MKTYKYDIYYNPMKERIVIYNLLRGDIMDSFVMEFHLEEVAAFNLGDIVYDVFIV